MERCHLLNFLKSKIPKSLQGMNAFIHKVKYAFVKAGIEGDDNPAPNKFTKKNGVGGWSRGRSFEDFLTPSLSITCPPFLSGSFSPRQSLQVVAEQAQCGLQNLDSLTVDSLSTEALVPNCFSKISQAEAIRMGWDIA